ncbi:glycolipid-anchored surface protein [Nadsonia fulvescens var. elongata DSM 6958]|uniref:1,3-beta-glucanosyltransferase n=1 Tax=Nadsonia fulvescens var. elongata DSM 6958 TaxID=857566 RepID=A0A1E3PI82_9ASCO|nr:glycolipid-anchored surface protein [Nadsonia fulvescens var. elongata DSM 6958]
MKVTKTSILTGVLTFSQLTSALLPIEVKGDRFIRPALKASDEGEVFNIIGVDYQPGGASGYDPKSNKDVLSDADVCLRDAYVLQKLGVNTIRIYTANPSVNHDECMSILNAAGIYVILDVNSALPNESLNRNDPKSSYNEHYLWRVFSLIDAFKGYPNVLGFFAGNEVINDDSSAKSVPPYMRAVIRDMKEFIAKNAKRTIPVGYSAADDGKLREAAWDYFQCGDDTSRADFYGLNSYDWCSGRDDWSTSGYGLINSTFAGSAIPLFMSEYGCNINRPRTFDEVDQGLYSGLESVFSGGLIYEYSDESNDYGLVTIDSDGNVNMLKDFDNLQKAYANLNLPVIKESDVVVRNVSCDASAIKKIDSNFNADFDLPDTPADDMYKYGSGNLNYGQILSVNNTQSKYKIYDSNGDEVKSATITIKEDNLINSLSSSENKNKAISTSASKSEAAATATTSVITSTASAASSAKSSSAGISGAHLSISLLVAAAVGVIAGVL